MYKAYFDGATKPNPGPASIGAWIEDEYGNVVWEISKRIKDTTINIAEYSALLILLCEIKERKLFPVEVYGDSQLVVNQANEKWAVNEKHLVMYQFKAACLLEMTGAKLYWIPRERNSYANELCQRAFKKAS